MKKTMAHKLATNSIFRWPNPVKTLEDSASRKNFSGVVKKTTAALLATFIRRNRRKNGYDDMKIISPYSPVHGQVGMVDKLGMGGFQF